MPVLVGCPQCGIKLDVPENFLGRQVRCASCSRVFEAKAEESSAPAPGGPPALPRWDQPSPGDEGDRPRNSWDEPAPRNPWDEPAPRRRERYGDFGDDYDDEYDDFRRSRRRRRDLLPHRAGMILTFGILSLVLPFSCGFLGALISLVLGPMAWLMGTADLRQIQQGTMDPDGQGNTRGGQICGIIGTCLSILFILACGLYLVVVIGVAASGKK